MNISSRFIVAVALCVALCLGVCGSVRAATYTVAPGGSDEDPGSPNAPWKTLQHAADTVGPGDRVEVRPGAYAGFYLQTSGTREAPIEFVADDGVTIVLRNPSTLDSINLEGASHIVIDGFEVIGSERAAVRAVGASSGGQRFAENIVFRNLRVRSNRVWGVFTGFVHDMVVENVEASGSMEQHGIYLSNSGDRPVVRNCVTWGNNACGIQLNADAAMGLDGIIEGAVIENNIIYDNGAIGGAAINLDGVRDSRVANNLLYNNAASGIALYRIDGGAPSSGNTLINNTIVQPTRSRWAVILTEGAVNNIITNNIILSDNPGSGAVGVSRDSATGLRCDHNVVTPRFSYNGGDSTMSLEAWRKFTEQSAGSIAAEAAEIFVDPAARDFRLKPDSPAKGLGGADAGAQVDTLGVQ